MALRVIPLNTPPPPSWMPSPKHYNSNISTFCSLSTGGGDQRRRDDKISYAYVSGVRTGRAIRSLPPSSSSVDTAGGPGVSVQVGQVTEVNKDTFWPLVKAAGDKTVVLDMYTQWCGPCKVIAPRFQELSEKHLDVVFLKLDCNQENKSLAKELGIKVVPTFKILKDSKIVKEVTGAKFDDLVVAIEGVRSS